MTQIKNPFLNFENKWVALSSNKEKVVTSADTIEALEKKVKKLGKKNVVFTRVPPFDVSFAPLCHKVKS